ncbi:MAG: ATP-binding protein, partial [Gaiellaceae bacterium]
LDDLHWADEPTVLLARHLATHLANTGVVILGAYRDTELDVSRPLAGALEDIVRERLAHRVTLKRLSEDGVSAMLRALGGEDPPPSLVRVIYEETEGNPFFVEEVFRHLVEEGHLLDEEGHFRADLDPEHLAVPESIRLVIGRRLERLGDQGRRALAAAGVVGPTFGFQVVKELEVVDEDFLLDVLEEAEQARLIVSLSENREPHFRFAHELIRQTLVEGLSLPRRQQLHLKIADTLERLHTDELEEKAADLAHHLYQAGAAADPDRTCRYLCLASHRALEASAFEEALRYLENALSLDTKDERNRADIFHQLGFAYRSLGRWDDALAAWDQALTAYERAGEKEIVGRLCGDVVFQLGWAARWKEAFEVAGRGLAALEGIDSPNRARLTSAAGFMFGAGGYWEAADEMFAEAIELAERLGDK